MRANYPPPSVFLRFVVGELHSASGQPKGIFTALFELEDAGRLADYEASWFHEEERWFNEHLPAPRRDGLSDQAVFWFRASANEGIRRMRALAELLRHKDIPVTELTTARPGRLVYEDEYQVGAVPYGSRRRRAT